MPKITLTFLCAAASFMILALAVNPALGQPPDALTDVESSARRIDADVRFLADDLLEGREAGTRGYELAAAYVAAQYRQMGLQPAGENGSYFQAVPLLSGTRERESARFAIKRGEVATELAFEQDFLPSLSYDTDACFLTAPMVFVGQAVHAPDLKHDDFAGIDLQGKVAVVLGNAPTSFSNDQRAYYSSFEVKGRELERRGAVGVISLGDPETERKYSWKTGAANWARPGMRVLGPDDRPMDTFPGLRCIASVPAAQADLLFAGSRYTGAAVFEQLRKGRLKPFGLSGTVTMASRTKLERKSSHNVVGKVPAGRGSSVTAEVSADGPSLAHEHVVLTAHLDHVGIGAPVDGDTIYNGAQDNAVGIAAMLEAGRLLMQDRADLQRSVLLVATTAEEKGLLGAQYFASHPTVPAHSMVANVNLDMPTHIAEVTDLIPIGIEHSTLEHIAREAVTAAGLTLTPDPMPDEVLFVRSDQYRFVQQGVPSVYLLSGVKRKDGRDGSGAFREWMAKHYHKPSDDLNQQIDWIGAARLAIVNRNIARAVAMQKERPAWNDGDFFGDKFGRNR